MHNRILLVFSLILLNLNVVSQAKINQIPSLMSILIEMEQNLSNGGSLETTQNSLEQLRAQINEEQKIHDQIEIELRSKDQKDAESIVNRATEQYENCNSSLKKSQSELDNNLSNQKTTETDIIMLEQLRVQGQNLFNQKEQNCINSKKSLEQSIDILNRFQYGDSSIAELQKISLTLIEESIKLRTTNLMQQISTMFVQLLTQSGAYYEVFQQLLYMLENMEDSMFDLIKAYQEEERQSISEYEDMHNHLIDYYDNLKKSQTQIEIHIQNMEICKDQQQSIIQSASAKLMRNSEIYESANRLCDDFTKQYEESGQARHQELELITQIKEQIQQRYGNVQWNE